MSDTDKTRPMWVQMLDPYNKGWLEEHHNHTNGICDIADADPRFPWRNRARCNIWPSDKAAHEGIYPRPTRRVAYYSYGHIRKSRALWRALRDRVIRGDIDAADESPRRFSHRHSALWDSW